MRIWNFLIIYSCWSDAGKAKQSVDENDTAAVAKPVGEEENHGVYLKAVLPPEEYKVVEKERKKSEMQDKLKVNISFCLV